MFCVALTQAQVTTQTASPFPGPAVTPSPASPGWLLAFIRPQDETDQDAACSNKNDQLLDSAPPKRYCGPWQGQGRARPSLTASRRCRSSAPSPAPAAAAPPQRPAGPRAGRGAGAPLPWHRAGSPALERAGAGGRASRICGRSVSSTGRRRMRGGRWGSVSWARRSRAPSFLRSFPPRPCRTVRWTPTVPGRRPRRGTSAASSRHAAPTCSASRSTVSAPGPGGEGAARPGWAGSAPWGARTAAAASPAVRGVPPRGPSTRAVPGGPRASRGPPGGGGLASPWLRTQAGREPSCLLRTL